VADELPVLPEAGAPSGNLHISSSSPEISVLIPTLNEAQALPVLMRQLAGLSLKEIIICDGGSVDNTLACARHEPGVRMVSCTQGRGRQIATGASIATGDILWILHADSQVPTDADRLIRRTLSDPSVSMGCFQLRFDYRHRLLSLYAFLSRFDTVLTTFGDQGYFMRRADYLRVGGCPRWRLFEDVALRQALRTQGRIQKVRDAITTSARRFLRGGILRTQIYNAIFLLRYFMGADPNRLAERYYGDKSQTNTPKYLTAET